MVFAWTFGFATAGWLLWWLGRFPFLQVDWADPGRWLASASLEVAVGAVARLVGLAVVAWLGLTSVTYWLARLAGADPRRVDWMSIGPVRRAVDTLLAGSLVVTSFSPAALATDVAVHIPPVTAETVDPGYVPVPAGRPTAETAERPVPTGSESPLAAPEANETRVVVQPGDHLWKLAERHLTEVLGRPVTDAETAPYWVRVIEANRARLRSGDPDLIYPGEEVVLPEVTEKS